MRDAQHLRPLAEPAQFAADDLGDGAADAGIHFVEHHAAQLAGLGGDLHRERQACEFAAGGDLGERPQGLARVRRDAEFDLVETVWLRFGGIVRLHVDQEASAAHPQSLHALADVLAEGAARRGALG